MALLIYFIFDHMVEYEKHSHHTSKFGDHSDIPKIHVGVCLWVDDLQYGVNTNGWEKVGVMWDNFRGERGGSNLQQVFTITQRDRCRHLFKELNGFQGGLLERLGDGGGVDSLLKKTLSRTEQTTREHDHRCCPITRLDVLSLSW